METNCLNKILIIDDEVQICNLLACILELNGLYDGRIPVCYSSGNTFRYLLKKRNFWRLYAAYTQSESLEEALNTYSGIPMEKLCSFLGVSVPLDTHVCRVAHYFKLTDAETFSLKNARQITAALAEVFPDDPCLGDFALFGLGVNGEI